MSAPAELNEGLRTLIGRDQAGPELPIRPVPARMGPAKVLPCSAIATGEELGSPPSCS